MAIIKVTDKYAVNTDYIIEATQDGSKVVIKIDTNAGGHEMKEFVGVEAARLWNILTGTVGAMPGPGPQQQIVTRRGR